MKISDEFHLANARQLLPGQHVNNAGTSNAGLHEDAPAVFGDNPADDRSFLALRMCLDAMKDFIRILRCDKGY